MVLNRVTHFLHRCKLLYKDREVEMLKNLENLEIGTIIHKTLTD